MAYLGQLLPPGPAPATTPPMAVIDQGYCTPGQITLKAKEKKFSMTGDSFSVTGPDGGAWFSVNPKMFSMRDKRVLLDGAGRPACGLQKKLVSLKPAWELFRGGDFTQQVATIKQKMLTLKPCVNVFLTALAGDGDKEPDFKVKGNFRAKKFDVLAVRGDQETVIAKIHKESRFSGVQAFMTSALTEADNYFIEAQPGTDLAFLTALCMAVDELFQDAAQS